MLTYSAFTSTGDRPVNEDSIGVFTRSGSFCFILCDGLGGHGMGDAASQLVTAVFEDQFNKAEELSSFLGQTFTAAQDILLAEQHSRRARDKMKTTAVSLVTDGKNAYLGHIGDSRIYAFSKNKVLFRTLDHSVPQMLALSKQIKESEIRRHPERNLLLKVLGTAWESPAFELQKPLKLRRCQAFLLCSDGFWENIEENDMCRLLSEAHSVEEWLTAMSDLARENGRGTDMDNYSAIAVWNTK